MIKAWSDEAWEDFEYWQSQDKKTLKRIMKLIKDIDRNGYVGIGKPEPLTGVHDCNRIVYKIKDNTILIAQCGSHYRDK